MIDLLKNKAQTKRYINTTGIEREEREELSDASGIQSFGHPRHGQDLEEASAAIRETLEEQAASRNNNGNNDQESGAGRKKIDIRQYKDPEGLTIEKMEIGLWLVKHRRHMINVWRVFLISVCVITWGRFFYSFGHYTVLGMRQDKETALGVINTSMVGHDYFTARSPQDLIYKPVEIISLGEGKYDFVVELKNINQKYWANFDYHFEAGNKISGSGSGFILPGETKYLLVLNKELMEAKGVVFRVSRLDWTRVDPHEFPDWEAYRDDHLDIDVNNIKFVTAQSTILTEKLNLNDLLFSVTNNTPFNYRQLNMNILLFNNGRILGVSKYVLNNFMSGDARNTSVTWPGLFPSVSNIVIVPDIDITSDDIYVKFEGSDPALRAAEL